jgi:signal transduction histidine kinase
VLDTLEIFGDRLRIKKLLYHLLSNAIKFMPKSGRMRVEVTPRPGFIEVSIADTGISAPVSEC